jgi:protein SCO1
MRLSAALFYCLLPFLASGVLASSGDTDPPSSLGGDFALTTHEGANFSLSEARGKVVLMMFGFTHCPDVCPDTLARVKAVMQKLGPEAERVQPLFITVDPTRDTPEVLAAYVRYFDPRLLGLTGTPEAVDAVVRQYRAHYRLGEGENYKVDHTAHLFMIDAEGKLARIFPYGLPTEELQNAVKALLQSSGSTGGT